MMLHPPQQRIAAAFGRQAGVYDRHAGLQRDVAQLLSERFPDMSRPRVLEIGCGTGLLTGHLLARYPDSDVLATDIAPAMLQVCRGKYACQSRLRFDLVDAEQPDIGGRFDLIASSMVAQWFSRPARTFRKLSQLLAPGGVLLYATTGPQNLPEWRRALETAGVPAACAPCNDLPGIVDERFLTIDYGSTLGFLQSVKAIGASAPCLPERSPASSGLLRRAMREADEACGGRMRWHIVFGKITRRS